MAADIGKVYPPEIHLIHKEIEVQGELIQSERLERKTEIDQIRLELKALKHLLEEMQPGFLERFETLFIKEKQSWNPELEREVG